MEKPKEARKPFNESIRCRGRHLNLTLTECNLLGLDQTCRLSRSLLMETYGQNSTQGKPNTKISYILN
jgi:hypothetical protein